MMFLFEEELDEYIQDTAVFPHPPKEVEKKRQQKQKKENAELKRIYKILGLTAKGKFPKTAAQRRVEKLLGRERS